MMAICERFGKLPSEVMREDAGLFRMLKLEGLVREAQDRAESRKALGRQDGESDGEAYES